MNMENISLKIYITILKIIVENGKICKCLIIKISYNKIYFIKHIYYKLIFVLQFKN